MRTRLALSIILLNLVPFAGNADTNVLENDVQLVFKGPDSATGGLVFEGTSIGDYGSGVVTVLGAVFGGSSSQLFVTNQFSFDEASGASLTGATSGRVQLDSLNFFERGTILTCFDELSDLCGCAFRLEGFLSGVEFVPEPTFIPDVTTLNATASISVPEGGQCLAPSDDEDDEDEED